MQVKLDGRVYCMSTTVKEKNTIYWIHVAIFLLIIGINQGIQTIKKLKKSKNSIIFKRNVQYMLFYQKSYKNIWLCLNYDIKKRNPP